MMDLRLECLAHLAGRAGKINQHPAGVDHINSEALRLEPPGNGVQVCFRNTVLFAEFLCCQPMMKTGRALGVEFVNEMLESFFLFRGTLQLEQHVFQWESVRYWSAIVFSSGLRSHVAAERDAV